MGVKTICDAAQQSSHCPKMRRAGDKLVKHASALTKDCTTITGTHSSVEIHLRSPTCDRKSARKAVSPLKKGLAGILKCYEKLSVQFAEYGRAFYLLLWFAGSSSAEKLRCIPFCLCLRSQRTDLFCSGETRPRSSRGSFSQRTPLLSPSLRVCVHWC